MKKLTQQIVASLTTGTLMFSMLASTASAATINITNSTNGRDSDNTGTVTIQRSTVVTQVNEIDIDNDIDQNAETGDNKVMDNFGGIDVQTGDVNQDASVMNEVGSNAAELEQCDCAFDVEIVNEKNGRKSDNDASFEANVATVLNQFNDAKIDNNIDQDADTGNNALKDNLDGDEVSLETGDVDQTVKVETNTGLNQAALGNGSGNGSSSFHLENSMNGRDSDNEIEVAVNMATNVSQVNDVDVDNNVDQNGETGDNDLLDNLGGAEATTGDINQDVMIVNEGGANALAVDDCLCDVDVEIVNEKNGRDSESDAMLSLGIADFFEQFNEDVDFDNDADQHADTGDNKIADNSKDDMNTGSVDSDVEVHNAGGMNTIGEVSMNGSWNGHDLVDLLEDLVDLLK